MATSMRLPFLFLYCFLAICLQFPCASSLSFSFDFSKTRDPCGHELECWGDEHFATTMIELTRNDISNKRTNSVGGVWYAQPVPLWNGVTGEVTSFTTAFTFKITPDPESQTSGDGMTFFLAPYSTNSILDNGIGGGFLGLVNYSNYLNASKLFVAVEFDTFLNDGWENSDQHIGIVVNSIKSAAYVNTSSPGIKNNPSSDFPMTAMVHYDNGTKSLTVEVLIGGVRYGVNATVDMRKSLPEKVAVGFSGATGAAAELHRVMSWSFDSTLLVVPAKAAPTPSPVATPPTALASPPSKLETKARLPFKVLAPAIILSACTVVGLLVWLCLKHSRNVQPKQGRRNCSFIESDENRGEVEFERGVAGPRRYLYRDLASATDDFAEENMLGRGGFGSVYKGCLPRSGLGDGQLQVAIKKFSAESSQSRKEFEAEVKIISRLRHRNLEQLFGWCDSAEGLLLVYELVPEGSLDKHIHNTTRFLTCSARYKIIMGLGSALRYLHLELDQCVVHGDIKPSNIMLDSSYSTKLGDFGLARLIDHDAGPQSTKLVQGTAGYIDPEFVNTLQRSTQSDVYSFGVVVLEIVSGRMPVDRQEPSPFTLLRSVASLYSLQGPTILAAADPQMRPGDEADERQMERALVVGLWCAHPDPAERPSVAQAMHALQSEDAKLPALSPQMYKMVALPMVAEGQSGGASCDDRFSTATGTARSS